MSWFSQLVHNPGDFISENPMKALGLLAAPLGLAAAPWLAPEIGAAAGGIGEAIGFGGAEAGALGFAGAEATGGEAVAGNSIQGLLEGTGGAFEGFGGNGGAGTFNSLVSAPELAPGTNSGYVADAFSQFGPGGAENPLMSFTSGPGTGVPPSAVDAVGGAVGQGGPDALAGGKGAVDAGAEGGSFWDKIVGGAQNSFAKNPLGIGMAGAGLGLNILRGSQQSSEMKALSGQAAQLNAQQAKLMGYLEKGTLPPGLQQAVSNATAAAKANAISNAARNGQSTDPTQNTPLAQQLASIDSNIIALIAQQGVALMNSGLKAAEISSSLYGMLEKLNQQHAQSTGQAIANFAAALSGGPRINVIGGQGGGMGFSA